MLGFRATQRYLGSGKAVRFADVIVPRAVSLLPGAGERLLHLSGPSVSIRQARSFGFELVVGGEDITDTPFASRCFPILHPSN
jgi:hypothetical protein